MPVVGIAAFIAILVFLVTFSTTLVAVAICMIAGAGIYAFWQSERRQKSEEKQYRQREWEREAEHQRRVEEYDAERQRLLLLVELARQTGARVDVPTLEPPRVKRLGKR